MTGLRLSQDVETELLTLLIEADRSENDVAPVTTESKLIEFPAIEETLVTKALKIVQITAAIPLMLIALVSYAAIFFVISVVTNSIRFVVAKVKKKSFELQWADRGSAGMVATVGQLKIIIYTNDHHPPHFHVITDTYSAKFEIETCELLSGTLPGKHIKAIKNWHANRIELLRDKWRITRPGDING